MSEAIKWIQAFVLAALVVLAIVVIVGALIVISLSFDWGLPVIVSLFWLIILTIMIKPTLD